MEGTGEGAGQSRIWVFEGGLGLLRQTKGVPHPHEDRGTRARPLELMTQVGGGQCPGEKSCLDPLTTGGDEMLGPHRRAGTGVGRQPG